LDKPTASLSLDLDNLWSYLKVRGDARWEGFPTYLPTVVPVILDLLERKAQTLTVFVIGQDAAQEANQEPLRRIAQAGHEIANHSLNHEPWMRDYPEARVVEEIVEAQGIIEQATGRKPVGFRAPGYCRSSAILSALHRLGYQYDASVLPSILGPVARLYYLWGSKMSAAQRSARAQLFGRFSEGLLPLRPFEWRTPTGPLLEIPVTTIPLLRIPFHLSYLIWLSRRSKTLALAYMRFALAMCRARGVEPSVLLHPLDFLGREDVQSLSFFPGMDLPRSHKLEMAERLLGAYRERFDVVPMSEHARRARARGGLKSMPLSG